MAVTRSSKKIKPLSSPSTLVCLRCGEKLDAKLFTNTKSKFFRTYLKIPYCRECINDIYDEYYEMYKSEGSTNPDRKAVERICMILDLYYSDKLFDSAMKKVNSNLDSTVMTSYISMTKLSQNSSKNYDTTIREKYEDMKDKESIMSIYTEEDAEKDIRVKDAIKMFGSGFDREDYIFLYNEYTDWTSRHECDSKSKEELIKQICFVQLDLLKANRAGRDTKDLNMSLTKLMDAAKLQPKQNSGDTTAENQTLGTLIDKWENTRPIPECDEELKDVDNIARYINVFFKGHLAKMLKLKNGFSKMYDDFMKKYTVTKPEYDADEDDEALFEAVFGENHIDGDDDDVLDSYTFGDYYD